jgi:type II secretory pathway component PulF
MMQFVYEAMRPDGSMVRDLLDAAGQAAAADTLREKGLLVVRLDEQAGSGPAAARAAGLFQSRKVLTRDMILFTRQMKMLLESGSPLVPALEATETQTEKPVLRGLIRRLRERVEEGASLSAALESEPKHFDPVFRSMIAAGEATATLPDVFGRLCTLAQSRQQTQRLVLSALLYPCVLLAMMTGVMAILLFFVIPRFRVLFTSLDRPLPASTQFLFQLSLWLQHGWPYVVGTLILAIVAGVLLVRTPSVRAGVDQTLVQVPILGRLIARLIFARVVRVWAAMLRCHVPLLEAIRQSKGAVRNAAFLRLIENVEEAVSTGGRMAQALAATRLADPIIVSAIRTGEENGRLAEAVDFVSSWIDEDNATAVNQLTRLAEPLLLAVMGVLVGAVAMSLFLPLFDMATAA